MKHSVVAVLREAAKSALSYSVALLLTTTFSAKAADYVLIPHSMIYNVDVFQDEYIAYLVDNKNATIAKCKAVYKLTENTLKTENCSDPTSIPFSLTPSDPAIRSTIVFTRAANHQNNAVLGPDGIWRVDQSNGKVEFCVFGDITFKCLVLNPS
ncbi:hypothetical protein SAMN05216330_11396 [Bradyrhizobium sp. Ghvi]|uniref:hypothetical protein n=1 Tax=Bradyrhizobium sp. Ghvi TaxID=1855319 RepID=UPI0008E5666A|nr:hypothetical protein [Bradyrhizobium sp. Ghvi]SFQ00636.1 hypothetical protein SAMN05216330_11396 [Bradyrhizobium sp. Ghvi]